MSVILQKLNLVLALDRGGIKRLFSDASAVGFDLDLKITYLEEQYLKLLRQRDDGNVGRKSG